MVGNRQRVKFWKGKWWRDTPLSYSFSSLFAITTSKEAWVRDVWSEIEGRGFWDPILIRQPNDWEVDELVWLGPKKLCRNR